MNVLRLALAVWLSVLTTALLAQDVQYTSYKKIEDRNGAYGVVGRVAGRLVSYQPGDGGYHLDFYDDSLNRAATAVLDFFPGKVYDLKFIPYEGSIVALYQGLERNRITQYAARLDDRGLLIGRPQKIREQKTGILGASGDYFSATSSEDKRLVLIYRTRSSRNGLMLEYSILNDTLGRVASGEAEFSADEALQSNEPLIGSDGSIYLAAYAGEDRRGSAGKLTMLRLPAGERQFQSENMPLEGHYAGSTFMRMAGDGKSVYLAGFYAGRRNGAYEGVAFAQFDPKEGRFANVRFMPFGDEVMQASGYRNARMFNDFDVRQLIIRNDGGFVLAAEQYFVTISNRGGFGPYGGYGGFGGGAFGSGATVTEYHYNDILALSYGPDGALLWKNFIRKSQYSQDDGGRFSSYALLNSGGSLGFLFNDFSDNAAKCQLATIDKEGKLTMSAFSGDSDDPDWLINMARQTARKELLVPAMRKRQLCFARVEF